MADRPIIFSAPMVRALLAGTKTQTRRLLKPQITQPFGGIFRDGADWWTGDSLTGEVIERLRIPYAPDDRLWVREQWSGPFSWRDMKPRDRATCGSPLALDVWYWADGNPGLGDWERPRTSIHMPRWASRLTLTVTEVRVQRLQEISAADAVAEGFFNAAVTPICDGPGCEADPVRLCSSDGCDVPVRWYRDLWTSLHGPGCWEANPWVVAVSFDVRKGNIDG